MGRSPHGHGVVESARRPKTTYTPDFLVVENSGEILMVDVKGGAGWEEDARVKIKTAARLFPQFRFVGMTWKRKTWQREDFSR